MTKIKIETDPKGHTSIQLTDPARFGGGRTRGRGLAVNDVFIQAATGHCFVKSSAVREGLVRLSDLDCEMIRYFLDNVGGPREPNVFAGDPPPDGAIRPALSP